MVHIFQARHSPDLYDLYYLCDIAHVTRWKQYNLQCLQHDSRVGSVLNRSYTASRSGKLRSKCSTVDRDLSDLSHLYEV